MLSIIIAWFVILFVCLSFGDILANFWNKAIHQNNSTSLFDTFWIGLSLIGATTAIISLFLPINLYILIGFIICSVIYWLIRRQRFKFIITNTLSKVSEFSVLYKSLIIITSTLFVVYCVRKNALYDFELYHYQSIMWAGKYKVIPGLGNIHGRLAFNSNYLLLCTLFSYHPKYFTPFFPLNGLVLLTLVIWLIKKISESKDIIKQIVLSLVIVIIIKFFSYGISSTSTDILVNILIIYILLSYVLDIKTFDSRILLFYIVPIFCVTLKLASVPLLLIPLFIFIRNRRNKSHIILLLTSFSIIIIPWCIRSITLSGYLVYPYPAIDLFSFDWKMPLSLISNEKEAAYAWARIPYTPSQVVLNMPICAWLPIWIKNQSVFSLTIYALAALSPILICLQLKNIIKKHIHILCYCMAFSGFIFGFVTAPDLRFTIGFVLCSFCIPLITIGISPKSTKVNKGIKYIIPIFLSLLFSKMLYSGGMFIKNFREKGYEYSHLYLYKPQNYNSISLNKDLSYKKYKINNINIYIPYTGDRCFDKFPCTPYVVENNLELRGEKIQQGFRIKQNK